MCTTDWIFWKQKRLLKQGKSGKTRPSMLVAKQLIAVCLTLSNITWKYSENQSTRFYAPSFPCISYVYNVWKWLIKKLALNNCGVGNKASQLIMSGYIQEGIFIDVRLIVLDYNVLVLAGCFCFHFHSCPLISFHFSSKTFGNEEINKKWIELKGN